MKEVAIAVLAATLRGEDEEVAIRRMAAERGISRMELHFAVREAGRDTSAMEMAGKIAKEEE